MKKKGAFFKTRNFGLIIGLFIFLLFLLLFYFTPALYQNLEMQMVDVHFDLRTRFDQTTLQEGVIRKDFDIDISPDILILGIDYRTIDTYGKWPFPRTVEANLLNAFTRIQDQTQRERLIFLDIIFADRERETYQDAALVEAIEDNGRVFLETLIGSSAVTGSLGEDLVQRQQALYESYGELIQISGDWRGMYGYLGVQPPLTPYGAAAAGYGHANFKEDTDKVYRRQALVMKVSEEREIVRLDNFTLDIANTLNEFERWVWFDKEGFQHNIELPLNAASLERVRQTIESDSPLRTEEGNEEAGFFVVRKYKDRFIPSITLAMACEYFNKSLHEIEVVIGDYILIEEPEIYDAGTDQWVPYQIITKSAVLDEEGNVIEEPQYRSVPEIRIPIDDQGNMLINFMGMRSSSVSGEHQTFPVRSFSGYSTRVPGLMQESWPRTKAVGNRILMVGAFEQGMADDEKPTPMGMMFGVEIHASALNTILMDNFLIPSPDWVILLIAFGIIMLIAFLASWLPTIWSLVTSLLLVAGYFITTTLVFDHLDYILPFSTPTMMGLLAFVSIVVYRVLTEENDKQRIRQTFGKYVSPAVVDQIIETPPELGGVDKELTVLFSDIRSFTTLSETMAPQELVNHLNSYLTAMTDCIIEMGGTLDKYVGDEIMCFWGAPLPQKDHAYLACKSALKQMKILRELNTQWPEERRLNIGIGVNSGIMTVGNMGSEGRMNYTLMGDNVNLGARLEGTNKQYYTNVIISEYTYELVKDRFLVRELDNIRVKGKNKPVLIYELIDCLDDEI